MGYSPAAVPSTQRLSEAERRRPATLPTQTWLARVGSAASPLAPPAIVPLPEAGVLLGREMVPAVDDPWMSTRHAEVRFEEDRWVLRDLGSINGTSFWGHLATFAELRDGDRFETGGTFWCFRQHARVEPPPNGEGDGDLATLSLAFEPVVDRLRRVARTRVPIMLRGATGTGKEVLARSVHDLSKRPGVFVAINTAAVQKNLVASELFGVERGAHSTAERDRVGQVRVADKGTLLLDEIGDMPFEVQAALLRMLQESEIVPVGGDRPIKVDVRIVCATHQDLEAMVEAGTFRSDLYGRLKGCRLELPTLAERPEDIGVLIGRFLRRYGAEDLSFSVAAYRQLVLYPWPLNIRELEKAIETGIALCEGRCVEVSDLPPEIAEFRSDKKPMSEAQLEAEYEREIPRMLELHNGNVSAVARSMGLSRMQIHRWIKRLDVSPEDYRDRPE